MANEFNKEERVAFEEMCEGFEDQLILSKAVSKYATDQTMMARANDTVWRPMPYILPSYDGMDQTSNFNDRTQLSVPATIGYSKSVPWIMDAKELRDALQEGRLFEASKQRLASDINRSLMDVASNQGTLVVKRTAAASGFDDAAQCESIMNETGVVNYDRHLGLSTRDYNGAADDLSKASRSFGNQISDNALKNAQIPGMAGFSIYKLDYANRLSAAAGSSITMDTRAAATNYYVPKATNTAATGERSNVDNRYQTITVSSTTNVAAGDAFTIAGWYANHHITKQSTGNLKTHRVISVDSSTTMTISPPIISNQGGSESEEQYQNGVMDSTASNAALVFLNTVEAPANPFWQRDALEILPGRYEVPTDSGAAVMRYTTDVGVEIVLQKFYDINNMKTKFRADVLYGVVNKQPEMSGIILFSQT